MGVQIAWFTRQQEAQARTVAGRSIQGGSLLICGGGQVPDTIRDRFLELAGGAHARIVIVPTANVKADRPGYDVSLAVWKARGLESVEVLHTRSRQLADDPTFVKPLKEATGVWFDGGDQSRVMDVYLGTEVERQFMALLSRGGVIGGNSAGAAVMTRVMITRGRTEASVGSGFDFLPGAVVDQHFLKRNRIKRLVSVLADHPELVGIGIDERTALEVHLKDRLLKVIGDSYVFACVPDPTGKPARLEILKPGDEAKMSRLKDPGSAAIVSSIDFAL
jgi:cyanophycinase